MIDQASRNRCAMTQLFLLIDLLTLDAFIGPIIIVIVVAITSIINILYQVWLIKYVRPLNKKEFEKVFRISQPRKGDSIFKLIKDFMRGKIT